ncbi:ribonuclease P protein component [Spiroplasma taiwanense]|uniref:Ribonuclease P protein component n=1 Tax=Spiroplasma taiwanense CT-1 TaxID=1276220 RepID=S5M112_9MOLU|nr:ribonuclease P protein component [Spiroplasma taiwanense]AGR41687.1 ribonuclease P (protein C5) [Spiroplasma taiwanense CT-1]
MKNKNIIKKNYEFQKIISARKSNKNKSYIVFFKKNEVKRLRYGISVGKKIGNAILRNKIKRQIRSMIYIILQESNDKNFDVVIIARQKFLNNSYDFNLIELQKIISLME